MDANKFLGGLNTDIHPGQQPENTTRYVLNFVPMSEEGNLYSISNESGTEIMSGLSFPTGFIPIGYSVLNSDIIVILSDVAGNNQVGYIVEDSSPDPTYGFYHPVAPLDPGTGTVPVNNNEFGFTQAHPVDCVSRKLINGHRILYFTDNNVPYGRVDLDNPPEVGEVADVVKLTFNQSLPDISIVGIEEGVASTIQPGIVQFITRYITETGGETTFGIPSNPLPMVPSSRGDGADRYSGEFYEYGTINKNIKLEFSNVDTKFAELEIVALYYEGSASVFKASIVAQIPITSDTIEYTYTGPNTEALVELTREELRKISISYTHAKCIEQKDNVLYLSNLRDERSEYAEVMQEIANKVRVKYRTQEFQFSGRGGDASTSTLIFTPLGNPYLTSIYTIGLSMSEDVDPTTGTVLGTYSLEKPGTVAIADISVLDYATLLDGDTIIVGAGPSQPSVTFTARTTPTLPDEFAIGTDNASTASNLLNAINSSTNVTEYIAIVGATTDDIVLVWSVIDLASNGVTVTYSGAGTTISTTNFAGATTTTSTVTPTAASVSGAIITLTFADPVSTVDTLFVLSPGFDNTEPSPDTETYSIPTGGLGVVQDSPEELGVAGVAAGFTDYTNESFTLSAKGYRRDEVYSLAFALIFKDGTSSNAFHIPGYAGYVDDAAFAGGTNRFEPTGLDAWPSYSTVNDSNYYVGTYVSDTVYPIEQDYPGNEPGDDNTEAGPGVNTERKVRHHLMPKLENEPHYRKDPVTGVEYIRILALDFEFTSPIPAYILDDVQEIVFLRERRNNPTNRSVISQGLTNNTMILGDQYNNDGQVYGTKKVGGTGIYEDMIDGYGVYENIFFGGETSMRHTYSYVENGSSTRSGCAYPDQNAYYTDPKYQNGYRLSTEIFKDQVRYHSPETNLLTGFKFEANTIEGGTIEPVLLLKGRIPKAVNFIETKADSTTGTFILNQNYIEYYMCADFFCNYDDYDTGATLPTPLIIDKARYLDANVRRIESIRINEPGLQSSTRFNQGGLEILADTDFPDVPNNISFRIVSDWYRQGDNIDHTKSYFCSRILETNSNPIPPHLNMKNNGTDCERYLYNIKVKNDNQYGQLTLASFIPIDRQDPLIGGSFKTNYNAVFGGDTFITKYAFNTGQVVPWDPLDEDGNNVINVATRCRSYRGYFNTDGFQSNKAHGYDFRTCTYYFVESNINTHYRHRPEEETKQDYFPNESDLSIMLNNYFATLGNIRAYNTQYSYENNVREYFVRGSLDDAISDFENRTIYSEQAAEDDTLDTYRSFLQNDYYDLPSETGPIWDTFIEYNMLFMHTPKSLWKTFAEPAATISGGNISDAVLGTGRLFSRPSEEVLSTEGGYGGTLSQFGGTHSKIGYVFADILQGKVFAVSTNKKGGMYLNELTKASISTFMHQELEKGIVKFIGGVDLTNVTTKNSHLIDNPYIGVGIVSGFDFKLNRIFLSKFPVNGESDGFTLTYSTDLQKWFSYHSYFPNQIISYDNRTLFLRNQGVLAGEVHEMNIGPKGSYFGTVYDSELTFVIVAKGKSSIFNNIVIDSDSEDRTTGIKQRDDNFYEIQVYNDRCNTGPYEMIPGNTFGVVAAAGQITIKFRNDEYRVAIPRDSVINNAGDIFDPTNLNNVNPPIRERIKGGYAIVNLKYDNSNDLEFVLNVITSIFNNNFR